MDTTASLIAIVTLCEQVIKYINAAAGAKDDRQRLRTQIRTCSHFILQLKDEAEDSEQGQEWAKSMQLLSSPLDRLHTALSLAAQSLSSRDSTVEKLKWPFKEKDVRKLIEAVECEMNLLSLALDRNFTRLLHEINLQSKHNEQLLVKLKNALSCRDIDQQREIRKIEQGIQRVQIGQSDVQEQVHQLHERHDSDKASEKRRSILTWLTPIDYASQQRDAIRRRQPGTGQWFINSREYQDWIGGRNRTLFCPGIPGAGKTVLASIINADLWERYHADSTVGLAHLFFDYRRQDQQSLETLLSGLLKQLVRQQPSLPRQVEGFYQQLQQGASDRAKATVKALEAVIADFSRVFIVLDAVDECLTPGESRTGLLCTVQELQEKCGLNLLATSRDIPDITERFRTSSVLEIRADEEDVRKYLNGQAQRLPSFVRRNAVFQKEVVSSIVDVVQGMYVA
ncbi:uncharacterized protein SETTUDRAFT_160526 [Exserohilum turcica Et28A]|uniref:NACHT domain-containing protein n=1 Tax=Exserohilum turcicum (strain 28A) TaxID=671987 RepID=R0IV79_EXST2|nr:uncharacterized protein SETTUDRAFT_160526 [Exserohilum turcica Et28A]EOA88660.1 hypothetical protein SETTUDRAFT_160526 [Exserohilum turcica Et28A]